MEMHFFTYPYLDMQIKTDLTDFFGGYANKDGFCIKTDWTEFFGGYANKDGLD